jgi:O-antigen ligase
MMRIRPALTSMRLERLINLVPFLAVIGWALLLVLAHSVGRIDTPRAIVLLALPIVALGVALRPGWVVLFLIGAPLAQIPAVPMRGLVLLLGMTLLAQLALRGTIYLGWKTGFVGLTVLLGAALIHRTELSFNDALLARGMLNDVAFYLLLGLVSYNATRIGELRGDQLINGVLIGLAISVVIDSPSLFVGTSAATPGVVPVGRGVAYLGAAAFAICFARLITRSPDGSFYHPTVHAVLAVGFLFVMIPGLLRGAWLSALLAVLLISFWTRRKRYWLLIGLAAIALVSVPVARERVLPNEEQVASGGFTTGRSDLWARLWDEAAPALPWGNGFGYTVTLTSERLFGEGSTAFDPTQSGSFVFPHNDFLFWIVELGVIGAFGMVLFWGQLINALRRVLRSTTSRHAIVLSGVLVAGFVSQLVGSTFFLRALAAPFFAVAGFIFGLRTLSERPLVATHEGVLT